MRLQELILDNELVGKISHGETLSIDVNPGKHVLKAKIDWCRSNEIEFNVTEGENIKLSFRGSNPFLSIYYITFGMNSYLKLEVEE